MKNVFYLLIISLTMVGCISKSDYQELKVENDILKAENERLKVESDSLTVILNQVKEELGEIIKVKQAKKYYSEFQAKNYLKDYYEFYESGLIYRNVKIRRIENNKFVFSFEVADKSALTERFPSWWDVVKYLTINNDGTYLLTDN